MLGSRKLTTAAVNGTKKEKLFFLKLKSVPIFQQLQIEEALLRNDHENRNFFIYNEQIPKPATIVLGISGKPEKLCHLDRVKKHGVPLIKRYSGGGTVIVDHDTIFTTLLLNHKSIPNVKPYPKEIMKWTSDALFSPLFKSLCPSLSSSDEFHLREDDYTMGNLKCGGNAQSITKDKWLHHTSFLWDFDEKNMEFLTLPERRPKYRDSRDHTAFLCRLKDFISAKDDFVNEAINQLNATFDIENVGFEDIEEILESGDYRKSTKLLDVEHFM